MEIGEGANVCYLFVPTCTRDGKWNSKGIITMGGLAKAVMFFCIVFSLVVLVFHVCLRV